MSSSTGKIVNPYLKKRSKPGTSSAPTVRETNLTALLSSSTGPKVQTSAQDEEDKTPVQSTKTATIGNQLTLEQRLPSRTVSFSSAEYLTVPELTSHAQCYTDQSVRLVAGVVLHRIVIQNEHDTAKCQIYLVIGDPMEPLKKPKKKRVSMGKVPPRPSVDSSNSNSTSRPDVHTPGPNASTKTPVAQRSKARLSITPGASSNGNSLGQKKRKLQYIPKSAPRSNLLNNNTNNKRRLSSSNKRRLSFSTPSEAAITCLIQKTSLLAIVSPPEHAEAENISIGDLVMMIGTIKLVTQQQPCHFLQQYSRRKAPQNVHVLAPRILRNINGTNVRLMVEALLLRRQQIQSLYSSGVAGTGPPGLKCPPPVAAANDSSVS